MMRRRTLSPVAIMDAVLARIEALNPRLNAYLAVDAERARAQAKAAEAAVMRGETLKPLHGLRVSLKTWSPLWAALYLWFQILRAQTLWIWMAWSPSVSKCGGIVLWQKTNTSHYGHKDNVRQSPRATVSQSVKLIALQGPRAVVPRLPWLQGLVPWRMAQTGRVDSHPGGAVWRLLPETVVWTRAELAQRRISGPHGHTTAHHAHCGGRCPVLGAMAGQTRVTPRRSIVRRKTTALSPIRSRRYEACV